MDVPALRVALVNDDPDFSRLLALRLKRDAGTRCETTAFADGASFVDALDGESRFDLVFLDVAMPEMNGLDVLRHVQVRRPDLRVVMVSPRGAVPVALEAMESGAHDYLVKGDDALDRVPILTRRAAERQALVGEIEALRQRLGDRAAAPQLIGESPAMAKVLRLVSQSLRSDLATAILGETGTGKGLVARSLHRGSARASGPFVVLKCGAIPAERMESELFGHERGAVAGADPRHAGVFEQADGGTLFLDEISELDPKLQPRLLRVLQDHTVRRVGGRDAIEVDVRVVSATHRDLEAMVASGAFREDLFYRLVQGVIPVPPLRERGLDVMLLADHFLADVRARHPTLGARHFTPSARRALLRYTWPGNVRELKSAVERAALVAEGAHIGAGDLLLGPSFVSEARTPAEHATGGRATEEIVPFEELRKLALEHALQICEGHIEKTADALGITRSTVYRLLKKYGIET